MDEGLFLEPKVEGRSISVYVSGDTRDEMEAKALDAAVAFFGSDVRFEIVPDYKIYYMAKITDEDHHAEGSITVRMVE